MTTRNTVTRNLETALVLTFIPLITLGILSLIYGIITGLIDTSLLS